MSTGEQTYLVKIATRPVKYGTANRIVVRFTPTNRVVGDNGLWKTVEQNGVDRSRIDVTYPQDDSRRADGTTGIQPSYNRFKILDRHNHLRILRQPDAAAIAAMNIEVDTLKQQLYEVRGRRAAAVAAAWRRAAKVPIDELETPAGDAEQHRQAKTQGTCS